MENLKLDWEQLNKPSQEVIKKRGEFFIECDDIVKEDKPQIKQILERLNPIPFKATYISHPKGDIKSIKERDEKIHRLEMASGMTLDDILEKFAAGYVLVPTRMVGAKFDEELCKRHADDSIDVLRFAYLIDEPLLNKKAIAKLIFENDIEIDFDEKVGERSDSMLNEEKMEK